MIEDADGNIHENFFDITDADQTFDVSIVDCQGNGNSCWGTITVEMLISMLMGEAFKSMRTYLRET